MSLHWCLQVLGELGLHKQQAPPQQQSDTSLPTIQAAPTEAAATPVVQPAPEAIRPVSPQQQQQQQRPPSPQLLQQQQQQQGSGGPGLHQEGSQSSDAEESTQDFAAMLSDMQDIVEQQPGVSGSAVEDDEGLEDNTQDMVRCVSQKFVLMPT